MVSAILQKGIPGQVVELEPRRVEKISVIEQQKNMRCTLYMSLDPDQSYNRHWPRQGRAKLL